ncbi:MAG: phosphoglycolate phosphatase [Phenylobacterium sp.]|uniref:HAD family hydrolase n=1 Tax=Phenylobacterium sp. TaxID=1871053 RepID=UPI0025DE4F0C|nr:HAD family hydrolase [Phenylobacterium sp.]MBA4013302.1 phosphoglycolate phosphatase [Phenylobacterium sp.]
MSTLPKAILFDLDETIISFGSRRMILQAVIEEFADRFAPVTPEDAGVAMEAGFRRFWSDEARAAIWRKDLGAGRILAVEEGFAELRPQAPGLTAEFARTFGERFHVYREQQAKFFPGALETIQAFRDLGVKLALVTNGAAEPQRAKVEHFNLAPLFDHVQIEGEAGFGKPEEQAYVHAMQVLGVKPHETWMVGDNLEWEVAAPQRLGIYAIWHDHLGEGLPAGSPIRPDRIVRSIAELNPNKRD